VSFFLIPRDFGSREVTNCGLGVRKKPYLSCLGACPPLGLTRSGLAVEISALGFKTAFSAVVA
jgi:hypothetical protein